jgi:hypothetical protein
MYIDVFDCQATSSAVGWVRASVLMGLVRVQILLDLFEHAMWYEVVWHLLARNLRQGGDSCTNQQALP